MDNNEIMRIAGQNIKKIREAQGQAQAEFYASMIEQKICKENRLSFERTQARIEKGQAQSIKPDYLVKCSDIANVSINEILTNADLVIEHEPKNLSDILKRLFDVLEALPLQAYEVEIASNHVTTKAVSEGYKITPNFIIDFANDRDRVSQMYANNVNANTRQLYIMLEVLGRYRMYREENSFSSIQSSYADWKQRVLEGAKNYNVDGMILDKDKKESDIIESIIGASYFMFVEHCKSVFDEAIASFS